MDTHEVTGLLKKLHDTLENTEFLRPQDREHIETMVGEIQALIVSADETGESALGKARDAAQRFEVSHPQLTAVLARIVDALEKTGI